VLLGKNDTASGERVEGEGGGDAWPGEVVACVRSEGVVGARAVAASEGEAPDLPRSRVSGAMGWVWRRRRRRWWGGGAAGGHRPAVTATDGRPRWRA
jgi:hypothetical protein